MKIRDYMLKKSHLNKWLFLIKYVIYFLVSFISWNYCGLLFTINIYLLFELLNKKIDTSSFIITISIYMTLWNLGAISWVFKLENGLYGLVINSFIYTIPFVIFYILKKWVELWVFIPFWLVFELLINIFPFSTTLITIGNSLANQIFLVQWYSYTSVLGGSFWLLLIGYVFWFNKGKIFSKPYFYFILFFPILVSLLMFKEKESALTIHGKKKTHKITVFNNNAFRKQKRNDIVSYLYSKSDRYEGSFSLILPESTISFKSVVYKKSQSYKSLKKLVTNRMIDILIYGAHIPFENKKAINTFIINTRQTDYLKVKKKLTPLVEYVPKILKPFYTKYSYINNVKDDLTKIKNEINIAPLICFEAFYPFYVKNITKSSKIAILLSSETFLNDSYYGKKQFLNVCKIRCVENNISMLKATNSGSSVLINEKGVVVDDSNNEEFYTFSFPIELIPL